MYRSVLAAVLLIRGALNRLGRAWEVPQETAGAEKPGVKSVVVSPD